MGAVGRAVVAMMWEASAQPARLANAQKDPQSIHRRQTTIGRLPGGWAIWAPFLLALALACEPVLAAKRMFQPPTIRYHREQDANGNRIDDGLDSRIAPMAPEKAAERLRVMVTLYTTVTSAHLAAFADSGGVLNHVYSYVCYGFSGDIPAAGIQALARALAPNLCIIEECKPLQLHLEDSTRIIGARPTVWSSGYQGTSDFAVAVLDTGIGASHADLSGSKVAAWRDVTGDSEPSAVDYVGHGTHVASTLAGTGAAIPASSLPSMTALTVTFTGRLPSRVQTGWVDTLYVRSLGSLSLNMVFQGTGKGWLGCEKPDGSRFSDVIGNSPVSATYSLAATGRYRTISGTYTAGARNRPFSTLETYPYLPAAGVLDGCNLFTGVAPGAGLAGVKIFTNAGTGYSDDVVAGMDWVIANRDAYDIRVASMSAGLQNGATMPSLRDEADTVVSNGIVFAISAGNDYPTYPVGDPALAPKVIAVGATNDQSAVTSYSSSGPASSAKPDVAAPGGSSNDPSGSEITAADTNDSDGETYPGGAYPLMADRAANDYTNMSGTSMSCPHVSGLAALVIQAWESEGHAWTYSESDALRIKSLILMTAYETAVAGEGGHTPPLTRDGTKDNIEGYGRICADAAIEAATLSLSFPASESGTLGNQQFDKRAWARQVSLAAGVTYQFSLTNPPEGDFDLYLYTDDYTTTGGSIGDPIIAAMSANAGLGVSESIAYTPSASETFYIVVKWVSGRGSFNLNIPAPALSVAASPDRWLPEPLIVAPGSTTTMEPSSKITVTNDGPVAETFTLKVTSPQGWTAGSNAGENVYVLKAIFCHAQNDAPGASDFQADDVVSTSFLEASRAVFCYSGATATGNGAAVGGQRALFLQFIAPNPDTQHTQKQVILTIGAVLAQ